MIIDCNIHGIQAQDSCPKCEDNNPYWNRALTVYVDVRDDRGGGPERQLG